MNQEINYLKNIMNNWHKTQKKIESLNLCKLNLIWKDRNRNKKLVSSKISSTKHSKQEINWEMNYKLKIRMLKDLGVTLWNSKDKCKNSENSILKSYKIMN